MAVWNVFTPEQEQAWQAWLAERPPMIREMAERWPPYKLYRYKPTGQRVYPTVYHEDGTISMGVDGRFNFVTHERNVFGINPNDLEECDLPGPDEPVGNMNLSVEEVRSLMQARREERDGS